MGVTVAPNQWNLIEKRWKEIGTAKEGASQRPPEAYNSGKALAEKESWDGKTMKNGACMWGTKTRKNHEVGVNRKKRKRVKKNART